MSTARNPQQGKPISVEDAELLVELEKSTPEAVKVARVHTRITVRAEVTAQPGNMSQRLDMKVRGVTGDVSAGGCQLLFPIPLNVGDIYWLTFDRSEIDVMPVHARCMRCRVIRDDAYEVGMAFFSPIELPKMQAAPDHGAHADTLI